MEHHKPGCNIVAIAAVATTSSIWQTSPLLRIIAIVDIATWALLSRCRNIDVIAGVIARLEVGRERNGAKSRSAALPKTLIAFATSSILLMSHHNRKHL